jgi:hypothetical protein
MSDYQKIIAEFKEMGFTPKVEQFQDRLIVQKLVYLLQLKTRTMSFPYGLHIRGPYSRALADELFAHRSEFEKQKTVVTLKPNEIQAVHELRDLFALTPSLLEVGATYAYFAYQQKLDPARATKKTKEMKKNLSETRIAIGISKAKEYLFQPTRQELESLHEELEPWQAGEPIRD